MVLAASLMSLLALVSEDGREHRRQRDMHQREYKGVEKVE
jgi:hypothetical protein